MPKISNTVGIRSTSKQATELKILGNLRHGGGALGRVVFEGGAFIDDERIETREEGLGLLGQPLRCVMVSNIDIGLCLKRLLAVRRESHADAHVRSKFIEIFLPRCLE